MLMRCEFVFIPDFNRLLKLFTKMCAMQQRLGWLRSRCSCRADGDAARLCTEQRRARVSSVIIVLQALRMPVVT